MTSHELYEKLELRCMALLCKVIDIAEWIICLFAKPCVEKASPESVNEELDFDFTFDFDTSENQIYR